MIESFQSSTKKRCPALASADDLVIKSRHEHQFGASHPAALPWPGNAVVSKAGKALQTRGSCLHGKLRGKAETTPLRNAKLLYCKLRPWHPAEHEWGRQCPNSNAEPSTNSLCGYDATCGPWAVCRFECRAAPFADLTRRQLLKPLLTPGLDGCQHPTEYGT